MQMNDVETRQIDVHDVAETESVKHIEMLNCLLRANTVRPYVSNISRISHNVTDIAACWSAQEYMMRQ